MNLIPCGRRTLAIVALTAALPAILTGCSSKTDSGQTNGAASPATAPAASAQIASAHEPGLTLPRGTRLQVRLDRTIQVKLVTPGDRFTGTLAEPVMEGDTVAVPAGSAAGGEILVAHKRGFFKGRSVMALTLTRLEVNGIPYRIDGAGTVRSQGGKGLRSAAFIGGGAVGLLVGGLAGGGGGALGAAFTGNNDLSLPAESVVSFRLQNQQKWMPDLQATLAH